MGIRDIYVTHLPFLQYSPFTEFCNHLALGVFQIEKAPYFSNLSKTAFSLILQIWQLLSNLYQINIMLCAIKVNSNPIELKVCTSCYFV